MSLPQSSLPGQTLGSSSKFTAGSGTHVFASSVCASIAGPVNASKTVEQSGPSQSLSIFRRPVDASYFPSRNVTRGNILPKVNSIVLGRVTRLQSRQINIAISIVDNVVCADSFQGIVRKEDVRGWEVDKVVLEDCFHVGDLVKAVVISLGDQISYYLSTARNELGVLMATSEAGNQMQPISWKEFRDPETGRKENRKVAKPV